MNRQRLTLDLDGIEIRKPTVPVDKNDVVIGEVPSHLRPLWSLMIELLEEHHAFHSQLEPGQAAKDHTDPADIERHQEVHAATRYAQSLFGERLQAAVDPMRRFPRILVRKDWVVVGLPDDFGLADIIMLAVGGVPDELSELFGRRN